MGLFDSRISYVTKAKEQAQGLFSVCSASAKRSFDDFWYEIAPGRKTLKSKEVLQAQFDEMGTLAVEVLNQHASLQTFLYGLNPASVFNPKGWAPLLPPYDYTKNADGTVTMGDLIP